ncbi:recombinase family protein [Neptuniibacter sp. CAU 1671]|uniref:recombinase family protein n=1 Tax=Neptuniibacter sp. CAU 1671 TaxID=3032593 RepID=UPI0023DC3CE1|nr:recombinase family protein [Neptuniibacter sp. CAU 1671]MDF2182516.1 hypothetical protein [Neptuniibacter sp. CAU 1671]
MAVVGYLRKGEVKLKKQRETVETGVPVGRWFQEKLEDGETRVFDKLLNYLWPEDTVALFDLHDLGSSADEIVSRLRKLSKKKVSVYCHLQGIKLPANALKAVLAVVGVIESMPANPAPCGSDSSCEENNHRAERPTGRRRKIDYDLLYRWREENRASILETASHFDVSVATVKRACRESTSGLPPDVSPVV